MSRLIEAASNYTTTENGAQTYKSTTNKVLDLFAMGGALRSADSTRIVEMITKAYKKDPVKTLQVLLYLRDVRQGQGEKRIYREALKEILKPYIPTKGDIPRKHRAILEKVYNTTIELGSWKDITDTLPVNAYAFYVKKHMNDENSLMFKWLPSISGPKNSKAESLAKYLGMTPRQYRKWLSAKRAELKLVETSLCKREWGNIEYDKIPSQASLRYREAFERHDKDRYEEYLNKIKGGLKEAKINTATLSPSQIVKKYLNLNCENEALEVLWSNLPNYKNKDNALVIADTSGSMCDNNYGPLSIALSLALYFAEHNTGIFRDEFITFSEWPEFLKVDRSKSLHERLTIAKDANWGMNTYFKAVFDMILKTAIDYNISEEEMPKTLYCVSDMEFDEATMVNKSTNFEAIVEAYSEAGYSIPKIVFWNVNSRQNNVPVKYNDKGVALVSGSSPSVFSMVVSGDLDPIKFMESAINKPRYLNPATEIVEEIRRAKQRPKRKAKKGIKISYKKLKRNGIDKKR